MNPVLAECIARYRQCAAMHGVASEDGNARKANQNCDEPLDVLAEIRQLGAEGRSGLVALLNDEDASVRCWAATHCLKSDPGMAGALLECLSHGCGVVALDASIVLGKWHKGTLDTP